MTTKVDAYLPAVPPPNEARVVTERLTKRESELVALLMRGVTSNVGLCQVLVVSENTVKFHLQSIYRKVGVCDRPALVSHAWRMGTVVDDRWVLRT